MSGHVRPEVWADLRAGRLAEQRAARALAHAASCPACRGDKERVEAAVNVFADVRSVSVELPWDTLGKRIGWNISSELRRRERESALSLPWARGSRRALLASVGISVLVVAVLLAWGRGGPRDRNQRAESPALAPPGATFDPRAPVAAPHEPAGLRGVVTLVQGEVEIDGRAASLDDNIAADAVLTTGVAGRVSVQFGEATGWVVEPNSRLTVQAFDDERVHLLIVGTVSVDVTHRSPAQELFVRVGARRVEVRGTLFRVAERQGDVEVTVGRGRVAVVDGAGAVDVPAGMRLLLPRDSLIGSILPRELTADARAESDEVMRVRTLPEWMGADETRRRSAGLTIAARAKTRVRVDGIEVGTGVVRVRTPVGRHLVEVGAVSEWVQVSAGKLTTTNLMAQADDRARSERPRQFDVELAKHRASFSVCGHRMRKFDPELKGVMQVEVGINTDGSLDFVYASQGLTDRGIEDCVLNVVRERFLFPHGQKATLRKLIRF